MASNIKVLSYKCVKFQLKMFIKIFKLLMLQCMVTVYVCLVGHRLSDDKFTVGDKSTCEIETSTLEGSVRLYGSPSSGILQIYQNGIWGTVCSNDFKAAEGHVACRQLGYSVIQRSIRTDE